MRTKYGFWIIMIALTSLVAGGVSAQTNAVTCPTLVQEAFTATEFLCETVPDGQACIGNGVVSTTPIEGATVQFANPGELATLADIQRLQTQTINTESQAWTSVAARLAATTPTGDPEVVDMLIFGDTVISNASVQDTPTAGAEVLPATVAAAGGVIVRQEPAVDSNNIWQLLNGETVQAIGRSNDNQWIRILIPSPNGGAGWIFSQFLTVEGGSELLPFQTNASPIPEGASNTETATIRPMQSFLIESLPTDPDCVDTPDSGVMLQSASLDQRVMVEVNGVELRFRGTVFITAQVAGTMTIYNLEGQTRIFFGEDRTNMETGTLTEIPLDADLFPTGPPSSPEPYSEEVASVLTFLPIRLLSRSFEITTAEPGTTTEVTGDTESPTEQDAPPPAPTEVPAEELPPDVECPTNVQEAYTATEVICEGLGPNMACLGNAGQNMVIAVPREGAEGFAFASPNDRVDVTDIESLSTTVFDDPENIWTSIVMTIDTRTTAGGTAQTTMLVFGEVDINNQGEEPATEASTAESIPTETAEVTAEPAMDTGDGTPASVEAPGGIIVRAQPRVDTETVGQLQDGDAVSALGRSVDQQWVQIQSPTGVTGWVFVQFIAVEGGAESLPIVDPNAEATGDSAPSPATNQPAPPPPATGSTDTATGEEPEYTSMQAFDFASQGVSSDCADTPSGGIIVQSPDDIEGRILLLINDVEFAIDGTVYVRSSRNENMNVIGLEGEAAITAQDTSQTIQAGQQSTIELQNELEPAGPPSIPGDYSYENGQEFLFLPIRLLPRNFEVIVPPAPPDADVVEEDEPDTSETADSPASTDDDDDGVINVGGTIVDFNADCQISAGDRDRNIRAGAGPGFDVVAVLRSGETIEGVTQIRGPDGFYWYETSRGWIRSDAGIPTPDCEVLPLYGVVYDVSGESRSGETAFVEPVAPTPPPEPTAPPPPPVVSEGYGNVCETGGFSISAKVETAGQNFVEMGGVWTGRAGQSVTFTADVPYYRPEIRNILTFVNEDGSPWLGSIDSPVFTINFDSDRRFRVRVGALLGDFITLRVDC